MYLTAEENGKILKIIKDNFDNACILMECLAKAWVKKEGIENPYSKQAQNLSSVQIILKTLGI